MKKYCSRCHRSMQKYGKTIKDTIRWFCRYCSKTSVRTRPDTKEQYAQRLFSTWTTGNQTVTELAKTKQVSRKTLSQKFSKYYDHELSPVIPVSLTNEILICDGIHTDGRFEVVLIVRTKNAPIFWCAVPYESYIVWLSVFSRLPRPKAIAGDEQKRMIAAILLARRVVSTLCCPCGTTRTTPR